VGNPLLSQQSQPASADVRLKLTCAASPCRFQQGEVIPVYLTFSAGVGGFKVMTSYPDRFEMGEEDRFRAEPADAVIDPVGDAASKWVSVAKGAVEFRRLGPDPIHFDSGDTTIRLELNQWLYFEKPGRYKITGFSIRLHTDSLDHCGELVSNPITVEIVPPDAEWQRQELDRILPALPAAQNGLTEPEKAAVRALTYLGSEDALAAIRKRLEKADWTTDVTWTVARIFFDVRTKSGPAD
jgi:hypothetical protein